MLVSCSLHRHSFFNGRKQCVKRKETVHLCKIVCEKKSRNTADLQCYLIFFYSHIHFTFYLLLSTKITHWGLALLFNTLVSAHWTNEQKTKCLKIKLRNKIAGRARFFLPSKKKWKNEQTKEPKLIWKVDIIYLKWERAIHYLSPNQTFKNRKLFHRTPSGCERCFQLIFIDDFDKYWIFFFFIFTFLNTLCEGEV